MTHNIADFIALEPELARLEAYRRHGRVSMKWETIETILAAIRALKAVSE